MDKEKEKIKDIGKSKEKEADKEKDDAGAKNKKAVKSPAKSNSFLKDERVRFVVGILITGFALYLLLAFVTYLLWWKTDQSLPHSDVISSAEKEVKNFGGKSGNFLAEMIVGYGFGLGAFFIPAIFGTIGLHLLKLPKIRPWSLVAKFTFAAILVSLIMGFVFGFSKGYLISGPGGAQGYEITRWMNAFMGKIGTGVLLLFSTIFYLVFALKVKPESFRIKIPPFLKFWKKKEKPEVIPPVEGIIDENAENPEHVDDVIHDEEIIAEQDADKDGEVEFVVRDTTRNKEEDEFIPDEEDEDEELITHGSIIRDLDQAENPVPETVGVVPIEIIVPEANDTLSDQEVAKIMDNYDPRLDLSRYKFPRYPFWRTISLKLHLIIPRFLKTRKIL